MSEFETDLGYVCESSMYIHPLLATYSFSILFFNIDVASLEMLTSASGTLVNKNYNFPLSVLWLVPKPYVMLGWCLISVIFSIYFGTPYTGGIVCS